jgi:hypothetical protein
MEGSRYHDGGYGVLKNELLLIVGLEHDRILVETFDAAGKLDATHQVDGKEGFILPRVVEKSLLDILRQLFHGRPLAGFGLVIVNGHPSHRAR